MIWAYKAKLTFVVVIIHHPLVVFIRTFFFCLTLNKCNLLLLPPPVPEKQYVFHSDHLFHWSLAMSAIHLWVFAMTWIENQTYLTTVTRIQEGKIKEWNYHQFLTGVVSCPVGSSSCPVGCSAFHLSELTLDQWWAHLKSYPQIFHWLFSDAHFEQ